MRSCHTHVSRLLLFALLLGLIVATTRADDSTSPAPSTQRIRVVTYNIKRGLGNDGKADLDRTAKVLHRLQPDIVGLQEVDENTRRSGHVDQVVELGRTLEMHHAFAPFMDYDGGRYGLAVLSQFPIVKATTVKLPEGHEPRVALAIEVRLPDGRTMPIVNLHFDWVKDDEFRFAQARELKRFLDGLKTPYLLMGDFNDVPESRTLKLLQQGTIEAAKPEDDRFTFSSKKPAVEIDYIFASPSSQWAVQKVQVIDEPVASDHRPVVAELSLMPSR